MPPKGWHSPFAADTQRNHSSQQDSSNHGSVGAEDEETARQERIRLDTYYLPDRRASCEAHGFIQMAPTPQPDAAALPSYEVRICLQQHVVSHTLQHCTTITSTITLYTPV
jgi:hypothetical protein